MKKIYTAIVSSLLLIAGNSFSQTFTFTQTDTAMYDTADTTELIFSCKLINSTSNSLSLRVTREQNVKGEAPTWTSAFCMDVCYLPTTDSVTYTFKPAATVTFTFHVYTKAPPDHATGKMRWRDINDPSNTFEAFFFGSTDGSLMGVNELSANSANVNIYPVPVATGEVFTMNVSNVKTSDAISMVVYDMLGSVVSTKSVIAGINFINLDLPTGIYSYNLVSGNTKINSGKLAITR